MTTAIDIRPDHLELVQAILRKHLPLDVRVWVFGSRATWTTKDSSDLDLALEGPGKIDRKVKGTLVDAFEYSDLPFTIDLVDMSQVSNSFRRILDIQKVPLPIVRTAPSKEDVTVPHFGQQDWRSATIGEIADIVGGSTPSTRVPANFDGDIPWITPKDLSGTYDRYVEAGSRNLSEQGLYACSAKLLPPKSVLLSTRAPIGYVAIAACRLATNQGFRSLVLKPGICPEFIYYWLKASTAELKNLGSGSTFGELSGSSLKAIPISIPPYPAQRAIAHTLGTLDDKIELNRRMNQTLDEICCEIFRDWFIDFGPVRAKVAGRSPYLPSEIWQLFPERLADSEYGPIPEGWTIKSFGEMSDVVGGSTPRTDNIQYWQDGIHCFATPRDLSSLSSKVLLDTRRKVTDAGLARIGSGLLPPGTVLLSSRAPIGYTAINEVPVAINQGFIAIRPHADVSNLFLMYSTIFQNEEILNRSNGTTFLEISKRNFRPIRIVAPTPHLMSRFQDLMKPFYETIVQNELTSRTLISIRDALMPRMTRGKFLMGSPNVRQRR